jgi:hypothetical protein
MREAKAMFYFALCVAFLLATGCGVLIAESLLRVDKLFAATM